MKQWDDFVIGRVYIAKDDTDDSFYEQQGKLFRYIGLEITSELAFKFPFISLKTGRRCAPLYMYLHSIDNNFDDDLKEIVQDKKFIIEDLCGNAIIVTEEQYNEMQETYNKYKKEIYEQNNDNT